MPRAPKRSELRRSGGAVMQEAGPVAEAASHAEVAKGEQPESVPLQPKFGPLTAFEQSGKKLEFRRVCSQPTDPSHSGAWRRTHKSCLGCSFQKCCSKCLPLSCRYHTAQVSNPGRAPAPPAGLHAKCRMRQHLWPCRRQHQPCTEAATLIIKVICCSENHEGVW